MRRLLIHPLSGEAASELVLLNNVASGTSEAVPVSNAYRVAMVAVYDNGVTAGEVILESARSKDYAGDWANEGSSTAGSNKTDRVTADGPMEWVRARIADPIVDGNVTVYLSAIGEY